MKTGSYFLVAIFMAVVVTLFLTANPASAWDTMPHYGNANPCTSGGHMVNGTHTGAGSYTFRLCRGNSTAATWRAQLINVVTLVPLTTCVLPWQATQPETTFTCTGPSIPAGTYLASITYTIPGGTFTHAHSYYIKP